MAVSLILTLKVASAATAMAFCSGTGLALLAANSPLRLRAFLDVVLNFPLVLPPTVLGYYLLTILGRNGSLGRLLFQAFGVSLVFTWQGAAVAAAAASMPLVYKSARAAFDEVPTDLEDAARTLGAGNMEVFLRISMPLAKRTILAGVMLAFARAMGEFGATIMIAGNIPGKTQTLSMAVYEAVQTGDFRTASAYVLLITTATAMILFLSGRVADKTPERGAA